MNTTPKKKFNAQTLALITVFAVFGMGTGYLVGKALKHAPQFSQRIDALAWWDLLLLPLTFLLVLAIHEAGHLLGGFRRGMRLLPFPSGHPRAHAATRRLSRAPETRRARFHVLLGVQFPNAKGRPGRGHGGPLLPQCEH